MTPAPLVDPVEADPFDLPEWLAEVDVVWTAVGSSRGQAYVTGALEPRAAGADRADAVAADRYLPCDLLAVDHAHPRPLVTQQWRGRAHADWVRGEVLLLQEGSEEQRLVLAAPGYLFDADLVLETLARLARAVGVRPQSFRALLRP